MEKEIIKRIATKWGFQIGNINKHKCCSVCPFPNWEVDFIKDKRIYKVNIHDLIESWVDTDIVYACSLKDVFDNEFETFKHISVELCEEFNSFNK